MKPTRSLLAFLFGSVFLAGQAAQAANLYWDSNSTTDGAGATPTGTWGSDNFWNTDSTGGAGGAFQIPTLITDDLFFSAGTDAVNAYAIGLNSATQNARLVTFEDGTATLSTGTLNLGTGGGITVSSNTVTGATISSGLTLSGAQTFNVAASRTLTLNTGTFTRNAGATLNVLSTGTVTTTMTGLDSASLVNGIIGPWASFGSGASTRYATIDGSNNIVGFTGTASTVAAIGNTPTVNYDVAAVGTLGAGANINTLRYTGAAGTIAGNLTTNGIMNASGNTLTFSGAITGGASGLVVNSATGRINFNAAVTLTGDLIIDGSGTTALNTASAIIGGTGNLIKNGSGNVTHDGNNLAHNFTGNVIVNGGNISSNSQSWLTGRNVQLTNGYIGGRFSSSFTWTSGLGTGANQIQITGGTSGFSGEGSTGSTFQIGTAGSVLKWGATGENGATGFFNPTVFLANGTANMNTNGKGSLNNGIDLNGTNRTITSTQSTDGAANSGFTISGVISNSTGTAGFEKTGVGNLILNNTNTFNGPLTISGGWITAGNTDRLGNGSATNTLVFNGGTLRATGTITSPSTRSVTMTQTGIIDNNGQAISIAGNISGAGGLTKNGTGTLTLSGTNSYGGVTTVNAGTLAISGSQTGSAFTVNAGTLQFAKTISLYNDTAASWTAANINVKSGATLQLNVDSAGSNGFDSDDINTLLTNISVAGSSTAGLQAGANLILDTSTATAGTFTQGNAITNSTGAFGGVISLTKIGAGTLIFDKANTYTGPTTISAGTLQLDAGGVIKSAIANNSAFVTNSAAAVTQGTHFGLIGGTGSLTQSGAGTLTLNLANTFSGTTTVSTGTLALTNALALQNSALVTTSGTSTYSGGAALTIGGLSGATGDLGSANVLNGYNGLVSALTLNTAVAGPFTYGGAIGNGSGAMSLTKTGTGTQILTGTNTYTGATIVNQGTLTIGAGGSLSSSSALQINGGIFSYGNTSAGQTLNGLAVGAGNSTLSNTATGQTLTLGAITRTASTYGTVNFATLTGPINTSTTNTNGIIAPWATTGSTTTLRYAVGGGDISALTGGAGGANLVNVTDATLNYEYSLAVTTAANLTGNTLRYSGGTLGTVLGATNTLTLNGLMNAGTGTLTISGGPTTGGLLIGSTGELVITANAQATTISAAIGGTGGLVYSGAGTLTLSSTTNAYTGGTTINGGTVNVSADSGLGNSSGAINLNGGILRGLTLPNTGVNLSGSRIVNVGTPGGGIRVARNNTFTTTGKLTGSGALTLIDNGGSGTLSTYNFNSTANDFTGKLIGANIIVNVNSFGNSTNSIALDGATFNYGTGAGSATSLPNRVIEMSGTTGGATISNANTTAANTLSIGGGMVVTGVGNKTLTLGGANTGNNSFSGIIADGPGSQISLSKIGAGTWVLGGNNTFTGATTIAATGGRLSLNNLNAIANSSSVTVASGTTLGFAIAGTYATSGIINIAGTGATLPGSAGALWFGQGGSYASTLNAPINMTAAATIGSFGNVMTQTLGGAITGTGPLTIQSQGGTTTDKATWTLNAASSYTGNTIFTTSGGVFDMTVKLGVDNALPTTTSLNLQSNNSQAVNTFTTFDLNGKNQELAGLTDTGGASTSANPTLGKRVINSSGTLSTLTINNAGAVAYGTTGTRILAGTIGGLDASGAAANNLALVKNGVGTLTLTGANTYTGGTTVNQGTLTIGTNGTLGANTGSLSVNNTNSTAAGTNAILNLATAVDTTVGSLSGTIATPMSGINTATINVANTRTLIVNQTSVGTYAGVIAGAGAFTLGSSSTNTLTLTGTNTYTGATNVDGGTLLVNGSTAAGSAVTVGANGTLGGTGTIGGTVNVTGQLSPGASIESLVTGALTMQSGSTFLYEVADDSATGADMLGVNGALSLTGVTLDFDLATAAALENASLWTVGDKLTLISYTGTGITSGFTGYLDDTNYNFGSNVWTFDYNDTGAGANYATDLTGANRITLTAFTVIPEPGTALLGSLGILLIFRRRR